MLALLNDTTLTTLHYERVWRRHKALHATFNSTKYDEIYRCDAQQECGYAQAYSITYNENGSIDLEQATHNTCANATLYTHNDNDMAHFTMRRLHFENYDTITRNMFNALLYSVNDNNIQHIFQLLNINNTALTSHTVNETLMLQLSSLETTPQQFQKSHDHTVVSFTKEHKYMLARRAVYLHINYHCGALCTQSAIRDFVVPLRERDIVQDSVNCLAIENTYNMTTLSNNLQIGSITQNTMFSYAGYVTAALLALAVGALSGAIVYLKKHTRVYHTQHRYDHIQLSDALTQIAQEVAEKRARTKNATTQATNVYNEQLTVREHALQMRAASMGRMMGSLGRILTRIIPYIYSRDNPESAAATLQEATSLMSDANEFMRTIAVQKPSIMENMLPQHNVIEHKTYV